MTVEWPDDGDQKGTSTRTKLGEVRWVVKRRENERPDIAFMVKKVMHGTR